jgi:chromosome segregation protein
VYLKKLTLKGFKSFADATTLDFEQGVTVVVGPNGSGKSNVVDAVAWALGAQAPSAMRSQRMDDVIFAGTEKRPALGRAQVSLTLDNASGLLPVEFSEVTITRTLFRSGDSEYAINDVPCRLLDVQDLLSASGVGRQQHVIVSQGQIDAVLNARPEERRLIIEEAAGILKYRKRKERSERRLVATEGSLTRLQDLLREVRRQLRPLERQAEAARRHGSVVAELTSLRVYAAGRELAGLRQRAEALAGTRADLAATDQELVRSLAGHDAAVLATEAKLTAMGGDDLGDDLAQFESLFERSKGQVALLTEQRRGVDRERASSMDRGVVASLEAEASRLASELEQAEAEASTLAPDQERLNEAEAQLERQRFDYQEAWSEGVPAPSGRAAEVRGELSARRSSQQRSQAELERVAARLASLEEKSGRLATQADQLRSELAAGEQAELPLVEALDAAESTRSAAESAMADAEAGLRAAQDERNAWVARTEALSLALDEARARAGATHLAGVDGVLGALAEVVEVDSGWEAAFEAAAGEALAAVVVADTAAGRRALDELRQASLGGAVLAGGALGPGSATGAGAEATALRPPVGESLRDRVRGLRPGVDELLDRLLGGVSVVADVEAGIDAALAHPMAVVVTRDGDRFAATGWRIGASGTGATGAALDEATERAAMAEAAVAAAEAVLAGARTALESARSAEAEVSRQLDDNDTRMTAAADALQRVEAECRDAVSEGEGLGNHLAELTERNEREARLVAELEVNLPELEGEESELVERARAMADAREALEAQAAEVGALRTDLEMRSVSVVERREFLTRRLEEVNERLARSAAERDEARTRREQLDRQAVALERLAALAAYVHDEAGVRLADLRERRRRQSEATRAVAAELDGLRKERAEAERHLAELRERTQRVEVEAAEVRLRLEAATEALRRDLDCEPDTAMAAEAPELAEGVTPAARIRELERDLRIMGPINPLALEEFEALSERHEFLQAQLDDVKETRRELNKVIKAIDEEIVSVFASAYADVSQNFEALFGTLFPGGQGRLKLTLPEDLLATGIEVEAKPSGKNVKKLSLLSGGERSLTALAFLFAVFRSRPSPFYVMDEVEAALDDVNLHRFLGLVAEFRSEAQLIIVSHQKRTMEAADLLYGVSMQPGGSSKVVSERTSSAPSAPSAAGAAT